MIDHHDVMIPQAHALAVDVVLALRELNGSGSVDEINEQVVRLADLSEEQQSVPRGQGRTEVEYRLAWARTLAKGFGLVENPSRGVWELTPAGWTVSAEEIEQLRRERAQARRAEPAQADGSQADVEGAPPRQDDAGPQEVEELQGGAEDDPPDGPVASFERIEVDERQWKADLLAALKAMHPTGFEHLCQLLLRKAGFTEVNVLGGPRDGGIDGTGVYRISLISFPVFFQAKRYAGTVGSAMVRDFRGAMEGRGDRGLLITTGGFTSDARAEATRDGARPVDLIDGGGLADLLREHSIGVSTTVRTVRDVVVDTDFFAKLWTPSYLPDHEPAGRS